MIQIKSLQLVFVALAVALGVYGGITVRRALRSERHESEGRRNGG